MNFLKAMFGNYSKREVKRVQPICDKVLALEDKYAAMSESELKNQTTILKERLANGETTDDILPEAFATCREAGWRVLGMKHFPVQIIPMPAMTAEVLNWHGASMESRMRW